MRRTLQPRSVPQYNQFLKSSSKVHHSSATISVLGSQNKRESLIFNHTTNYPASQIHSRTMATFKDPTASEAHTFLQKLESAFPTHSLGQQRWYLLAVILSESLIATSTSPSLLSSFRTLSYLSKPTTKKTLPTRFPP